MKKIMSTVAALGLVAGMATAAQALEFKVSGHYFVEGVYQSSGDGAGVSLIDDAAGDENGNDAFWRHEFVIRPVMKVNDKIVVKSKIYLANSGVDNATGSDGMWGSTDDEASASGNTVDIHHLFMEYMSPIGKVRVGRTSGGLWQGDFLSSDKNQNRLMYFPNFLPKPFGACVFLQKTVEADSITTENDSDYDLYEASAWYKTKDLIVALAYDYFDDARSMDRNGILAGAPEAEINKHLIKGYYNQNAGNMYAEMEFAYVWGDKEWDDTTTAATDDDYDSFAIMADVGMTMGNLDIGVLAFYASGDGDTTDDDLEAALSVPGWGLGEQFQPYTILTGATTGMLTGDYNSASATMTAAGVISLGVHADFAVNDKLTLHSAIAYAEADDAMANVDDEYGWEIDLGISYALLDNLTYAVDFGYLMTGDFFEGNSVTENFDTNDIYVMNHRLTMEF